MKRHVFTKGKQHQRSSSFQNPGRLRRRKPALQKSNCERSRFGFSPQEHYFICIYIFLYGYFLYIYVFIFSYVYINIYIYQKILIYFFIYLNMYTTYVCGCVLCSIWISMFDRRRKKPNNAKRHASIGTVFDLHARAVKPCLL